MEALFIATIIGLLIVVNQAQRPLVDQNKHVFKDFRAAYLTKKQSRVQLLQLRRQRVYKLYLAMISEKNELKANQAMLIIKRIDNELSYYYYSHNFKFN